jgi:predicted TIM-barrel fold metal-dependent hydrolase
VIIDVHSHVWEKHLIRAGLKDLMESVAKELVIRDPENLENGSIERLIQDMDDAGIDKTVILPLDFEFLFSGGGFTFRDFNNLAGDYVKRHPDRIIAFAGVDPRRRTGAVDELRRCVEELGFRGLKLWTVACFVPDDETFYPLYEEAARLGVHVLVHTGLGPGQTYLKTCRPVFVDKLAVDFREIRFIMAHVGTPWADEALAVAAKNPNVYVDISAWQKVARIFPLGLAQVLSTAKLMHAGVHKVLFGSDWPLFTEIYSQKEWVEVIRSMPYPPPLQLMGLPEITEEDKARILGGNAQEALGLKP